MNINKEKKYKYTVLLFIIQLIIYSYLLFSVQFSFYCYNYSRIVV